MPAIVVGISLAAAVPLAPARTNDEPLPQTSDEILVEPASATPFLGEQLTLTAILHENPDDCCNKDVRFVVLDGPNAGTSQTVTSNSDGVATFTYSSATAGTDQIQAQFHDSAEGQDKGSNVVPIAWQHATVGLTVPDRPPALVKPPDENTFAGANDEQELPRGTVVDIGGNRAMTIQNYLGDRMTFVGVPDRVPSRFQLLTGVRSRIGVISMNLVGGNFKQCIGGTRTLSVAGAAKKKPQPPVRRLWGFGKGHYKTSGKYASATVRGTFWEIADYCNGTLIHVREGTVTVYDFTLKKNVTVTTGQSYFAKAPS